MRLICEGMPLLEFLDAGKSLLILENNMLTREGAGYVLNKLEHLDQVDLRTTGAM